MPRNGLWIYQEAFSLFQSGVTPNAIAIRLDGNFGGLDGYSILFMLNVASEGLMTALEDFKA